MKPLSSVPLLTFSIVLFFALESLAAIALKLNRHAANSSLIARNINVQRGNLRRREEGHDLYGRDVCVRDVRHSDRGYRPGRGVHFGSVEGPAQVGRRGEQSSASSSISSSTPSTSSIAIPSSIGASNGAPAAAIADVRVAASSGGTSTPKSSTASQSPLLASDPSESSSTITPSVTGLGPSSSASTSSAKTSGSPPAAALVEGTDTGTTLPTSASSSTISSSGTSPSSTTSSSSSTSFSSSLSNMPTSNGSPSSSGSSSSTGTSSSASVSGTASLATLVSGTLSTSHALPSASNEALPLQVAGGGVDYTIDVTIVGQTNITVPVTVDTGSFQFWVVADQCASQPSASNCGSMKSAVSVDPSCQTYARNYGSGSLQGCLTNATVAISSYLLPNYGLMAAMSMTAAMQAQGSFMSGIWGFGQSSGTENGMPTPLDTLLSLGEISQSTAGFYLPRTSSSSTSQIILGDVNNLPTSDFTVDPATKATMSHVDFSVPGLYTITLDGLYTANGTLIGQTAGQTVIVDTGSTEVNVPPELLPWIYGALGLNGDAGQYAQDTPGGPYVVPCAMMNPADTALQFGFGGQKYKMQWQDLVAGGQSKSDPGQYCMGTIVATAVEGDWLIGGAFLHNVFHSVNSQDGSLTMYQITGS